MYKSVFNEPVDRSTTHTCKWDMMSKVFGREDLYPLWVADMELPVPNEITKSLKKRADNPIYGYTLADDYFYDSIISWLDRRHSWQVDKSWFLFSPTIVTSLSLSILALTEPNDKVVIQTPVYHPFFKVINRSNRQVVNNPLIDDNGHYKIDFDHLDKVLAPDDVKLMFLCSPHNPVARVWTKDELTKLADICIKNKVIIISDEIHSDLIFDNNIHTPIANISPEIANNTITFTSPSKTFNVAGLQASVIITSNKALWNEMDNVLKRFGLFIPNVFAVEGFASAYNSGELWLTELLEYLTENRDFMCNFIKEHIPKIKIHKPEGTYLAWLNCKELGLSDEKLRNFLIHKAGLALEEGVKFGDNGTGYQRLNFAVPRPLLKEALNSLKENLELL